MLWRKCLLVIQRRSFLVNHSKWLVTGIHMRSRGLMVKILLFSRWLSMCLQIMCSSSLHEIQVNETGL